MQIPEHLPKPIWIIVPDHHLAVRCWYEHTHTMSFHVFDVAQEIIANQPDEETWVIAQNGEFRSLNEWADTHWELNGGLKWDGCINWQTHPECMAHACGPSLIGWIEAVFTVVYAIGKRNMDLLGDEVPPLPEGCLEIVDP